MIDHVFLPFPISQFRGREFNKEEKIGCICPFGKLLEKKIMECLFIYSFIYFCCAKWEYIVAFTKVLKICQIHQLEFTSSLIFLLLPLPPFLE
jgi:hypothetical protein